MGLPLWIESVEPQVEAMSAEKIAAATRSSIRRQRGIRAPHARLTAESRRRRLLEGDSDYEWQVLDMQHGRIPNDAEPRSASFRSRPVRLVGQERSALRDSLSFERVGVPDAETDGPLPPVPESRDFPTVRDNRERLQQLRQLHDIQRMGRRQPAPTPPAVPSMSATRPGRQRSAFSSDRAPSSIDPDFSFISRDLEAGVRDFRVRNARINAQLEALNRRNGTLQSFRQGPNGLGDRDRSLSPEGSSTWETLLTSITPDPQPPSAGSSFASSSASAAASSNSGPSSSTSMTSRGVQDDSPAPNDCDVSGSGSDGEEEGEDIYELQDFNRRSRGNRFWRTYADVVTSRADSSAQEGISDPEQIRGLHRIISALAEQDDVPDEWWASAGLSRNLRREEST